MFSLAQHLEPTSFFYSYWCKTKDLQWLQPLLFRDIINQNKTPTFQLQLIKLFITVKLEYHEYLYYLFSSFCLGEVWYLSVSLPYHELYNIK